MVVQLVNRLVIPTGTPDMTLNGAITNVATSAVVLAVAPALGTVGDVMMLIYAVGDDNPELIKMTSRSTTTLTVVREAEEATAYPKCAHADGAGLWIVQTAGSLAGYVGLVKLGSIQPTGTNVDFTSIPSGYKHLKVVWQARADNAVTNNQLKLQFNGDTGSNYDWGRNLFNNSGPAAPDGGAGVAFAEVGLVTAASSTAAYAADGEIVVPNYAGTTFNKGFIASSALLDTSETAANIFGHTARGFWKSTAAINEIKLTLAAGNFVAGSTFELYGMA